MDQIKIGQFIAETRKERGLTQRQLAQRMEISDKTISKWECGNGLPEMSSILPLCEVLQINVNELLSGEKLSQTDYSRKAEENMMHLIQETEEQKKNKKNIWTILCFYVAAILAVFVLMPFSLGMGAFSFWYLINPEVFGFLIMLTVLFTVVSGNVKIFFNAFVFAFRKEDVEVPQMRRAAKAIDYVRKVLLYSGLLISLLSLLMLLHTMSSFESIGPYLASALIGTFYGVFLNLLLLSVKSRLEQ